jgi:TRAP-type C4-dicarboxylate transport system substrate-binding protein
MKYRVTAFAVCVCLLGLLRVTDCFAQRKVTIKLAALIPENTPWGEELNNMAAEWKRISEGNVELVIYYNIKSDESDLLRQLNLNQIQAAMLSTVGMKLIAPEGMTLSCPFLIRNNEELDLVLNALKPELESLMRAKGYHTLAWSKVGWVRFFSKRPVFVPNDLKKQRVGTADSEPELLDAFRAMGYNMTPVAMNQILVALSAGQIDAVYQSPVNAGGLQIFGLAKNMASIRVAPFMGNIVLNQKAWRSIPEKYRDELMASAKRLEAKLDKRVMELEDSVIGTMKDYGLVINDVSPEQEKLWYADFQRSIPSLMGVMFDRSFYNRISAMLEANRAKR